GDDGAADLPRELLLGKIQRFAALLEPLTERSDAVHATPLRLLNRRGNMVIWRSVVPINMWAEHLLAQCTPGVKRRPTISTCPTSATVCMFVWLLVWLGHTR